MSALRQFDMIRGVLEPKRTDDLKPSAVPFIGMERDWDVAWMITEEDGGPYVGQYAIGLVLQPGEPRPDFTWVPECDIRVLEITDRLTSTTEPEYPATPASGVSSGCPVPLPPRKETH